MEKKYEKDDIYIYLNYFAIQQKLTQHCKSTTLLRAKKKESVSHSMHATFISIPMYRKTFE